MKRLLRKSSLSFDTKRRLNNKDDMLNTFQGMQGALKWSVGDFHWGLPHHLLGQGLAWMAQTHKVKPRPGFPSFWWAGWLYGDDNWCSK